MPRLLDASSPGFEAGFAALLLEKRESSPEVDSVVRAIIENVRTTGDRALLDYTRKFDRVSAEAVADLIISSAEIDRAVTRCSPEILRALDLAAERIDSFHRRQLPSDDFYIDGTGTKLGMRWRAVDAVGLYVPGGTASYPSSVLMNAMPARVAGVERIVMVVPTPDDHLNPLVLAAARRAGVTEIYRVGGAQAVAALAFGTETIRPVDKIVGPGNAYVAAAKRQVYGTVGIDSIAGPSEILVIADGANDPAWIAADLLSQAEHDRAAQSILITDDRGFAEEVLAAVERHLATLDRTEIARDSWLTFGAAIVVPTITDAIPLANRIAAEHLELAVAEPEPLAAQIRHAGAIFLGRFTPEAIGDYVAGPNHVLPTARTARFSSGLGVLDFMKRTTFVGCTVDSLAALADAAMALARSEGLDAHALSVAIRSNRRDGS